jgi:hypothetical protein
MKRLAPIVILAVLGTFTPAAGQRAPAGDVSNRVIRLQFPSVDFAELIPMMAMMNKLPMGFQQRAGQVEKGCEMKRDVLFPNGIQVGMFMSSLLPDCPGYSWSGGSVLSVFPSPKEDSVLDVKIPEFAVEQLTPEETLDRIFELPEVKRYLKDKKLSRTTAHKGLSTAILDPKKYRFTFTNKSVRDVLNHIVTTTGYKVWVHQGPAGKDREINVRIF